ncbi:MAG: phosphatidylserine decarboxylase family protein [Blastocatellia bacterium]|nr:phosphatidylserine decarboxylase family protein [Blastocatellia bacterium]MCS7157156.1 phosphatidylserine decarboxylase family protein [Blastocatellia bacterium]MCX7752381.1 phosphatidylserine decarboxylase family protein [Blastocatellia bacterium]MDW8167264.1 phosphatidylserine decarboxylase family protein [Acidobacteriota bacterium]
MIVREGWPYIAGASLPALIGAWLHIWPLVLGGLGLALFFAYFFRDPDRTPPEDERAIVSPADGRVVALTKLDPNDPRSPTRLSIFLSPLDVHVNRAPMTGRIVELRHRPGRFLPAMRAEASIENEQTEIRILGAHTEVVLKQIAGIFARRIVCWKRSGDLVHRGERIGLIKFGSRTDLLLPSDVEVLVRVGDRVRGGSTIVARIRE